LTKVYKIRITAEDRYCTSWVLRGSGYAF